MCGIIAVSSKKKPAQPSLIYGLKQMEYRGYDSAGIIFTENMETYKSIGSLKNLENATNHIKYTQGIGHTRWATHGEVSLINTHPIKINEYAIVHNGIIENTQEIIQITQYKTQTSTDTELILAYFIHANKANNYDLEKTLRQTYKNVQGSYAIAITQLNLEKIIWMKKGFSPLVLAQNEHGCYIASDQEGLQHPAITYEITSNAYGYITKDELKVLYGTTKTIKNTINTQTEINQYKTWLEKEIYDQEEIFLKEKDQSHIQDFSQYSNIKLIGCGTSFFAAEIGALWLEEKNCIASASIASEWNTSSHSTKSNQLAIFLSQSGFTADTLAALLKAKETFKTLSIVNKENSPIDTNADQTIYLNAGTEKSVASTKAFTSQLIKLWQLINGQLPNQIEKKISNILKIDIAKIIDPLLKAQEIFILGKNKMNIIAKEGMLKITEITYLNVFAYPAGELKHGYISKITEKTYIIILAPNDPILLDKTISSAQEILSRKGKIIWISDQNHIKSDIFIQTESMNYDEATFCYPILLQKIALKLAEALKRPIDKPRNLAKSVTVE